MSVIPKLKANAASAAHQVGQAYERTQRGLLSLRHWVRRHANLEPFLPAIMFAIGLAAVFAANFLMSQTGEVFLIVGGILGAFVALWIALRPQIGLYIIVIFTYMNLSDVLEVSFGIPKINQPLIGLILVSVLANRIVLKHKPIIFRGIELTYVLYGVIATLSVIFAKANQDAALDRLVDWVKDFAIAVIIVQLADEEKSWRTMAWCLILSGAFIAALSWYQTLTGDYENTFFGLANYGINQITQDFDSARVTGPLVDPNFYAQILGMVLPFAAYRMLVGGNQLVRLIGLACTVSVAGAIVFTYSRGGMLAMLAVFGLIVLERRYNLFRVAIVSVVGFIMIAPILPAGYLDRIITLGSVLPGDASAQTEVSFRGRSSEMIIATQMFSDNPILGVGKRNYQELYLDYSVLLGLDTRLEDRQAHSLYLELAAEMGSLGILAFAAMLSALFVSTMRARREFRELDRPDMVAWTSAAQFGVISYMITSIFLHNDYARYMWMLFAIAGSTSILSAAMMRRRREVLAEQQRNILPLSPSERV